MNIKSIFNAGVMKAHTDIVGFYLSRIQSVIVILVALSVIFGWFIAVLVFIVLVIMAFVVAVFHMKYIYPDEINYIRKKDPFMLSIEEKLNKLLEKYE